MTSLLNLILAWFTAFFNTLKLMLVDFFIEICNAVLFLLGFLIQFMSSLMPSLTLGTDLITQFPTPHTAICWLTWLFPVDVLFQCTQFYISLYLLKFMSGPILRFLKIVS
jgi:hypothetical protein